MNFKIKKKQYEGGLPEGGSPGYVLKKNSSRSFDADWAEVGSANLSPFSTAASATIFMEGENNDIFIEAVEEGAVGNEISFKITEDPIVAGSTTTTEQIGVSVDEKYINVTIKSKWTMVLSGDLSRNGTTNMSGEYLPMTAPGGVPTPVPNPPEWVRGSDRYKIGVRSNKWSII
jgi:hypothetical protein